MKKRSLFHPKYVYQYLRDFSTFKQIIYSGENPHFIANKQCYMIF
jgi:hypothetical protein